MEITKILEKLKKRIDWRLEKFFKHEIKQAGKVDETFKEATEMVADFTLRGGKRVRAILMYFGYLACGGKKIKAILDASLCMELAHSFLLIHDDIIDNDQLRRGKPTLHKEYEKLFWKLKIKESQKVGQSLAMLCGDSAYTLANKALCESNFDEKLKIEAIKKLQLMINQTAAGEVMDVVGQFNKKITTNDIINIYKYKTAKYTIEGPLCIGCLLGGGSKELKKTLSQYAIYLGIAFQIHDDTIDIFGEVEETGKDVGSDIKENKKTLIIQKTLELANKKEKKEIKKMLGNKKLTKKDIDRFRKICEESKAFEFCLGLANNLSLQAKEIILKSKISGLTRDFLLSNADYIIERKK